MRLGQRLRVREPEPARQLRGRQIPRQLQQRERVAAGLGDDPVAHPLVQRAGDRRRRAARARRRGRVRSPRAPAARELVVLARLAHREHERRPARPAAGARRTPASARTPGRATARRRRGRPADCCSAASASRLSTASPTRNRSGGSPSARPNAACSASRCGDRQSLQLVEHRRAQLMQAGEGELHLGLHARRPGDPTSRRAAAAGGPAARSCRRPLRRAGPARRLCPARTSCSSRSSTSHSLVPTTQRRPRRGLGHRPPRVELARGRLQARPRARCQTGRWAGPAVILRSDRAEGIERQRIGRDLAVSMGCSGSRRSPRAVRVVWCSHQDTSCRFDLPGAPRVDEVRDRPRSSSRRSPVCAAATNGSRSCCWPRALTVLRPISAGWARAT